MTILTTESQRHRENGTMIAQPTLADAMQRVVGCVLSSVTFVADYVQLDFNGPGLTTYTMPVVKKQEQRFESGNAGYRDALCEQIGRSVEHVAIDDQHVSIRFDGGGEITVSLLDKDYIGPEALQFFLNEQRMWVV